MSKFTEFFQREYARLVRYVRRLVDDAADRDAEDIVQDVMLSIFDKADVTIPIENFAAYVYRSLRNKVIDIFRKKENVLSLPDVISDAGYDTERKVERKELMDFVFRALDSLPDEQREVVIATELEGWSFRELSERWEVPIGTLLARKSRALQHVRKKLTRLV
ncbi:MAG: RNA polymerase sigma factor [Candidatus Aminicenantes bacterium]|nr:MAG: RNA polymerase sigma factor [Candidatus Aminicenantes bacterium]